jgi:hypothetical protein
MDDHLNYRLDNNEKDMYDPTLGYRWIPGNNTFVVLVGDIIDPCKHNRNTNQNRQVYYTASLSQNYYTHIEIKIILFLNELNRQALQHNGRVIKIMGNHELLNFKTVNFNNNVYNYDTERYYFAEDVFRNQQIGNNTTVVVNQHNPKKEYFGNHSREEYFSMGTSHYSTPQHDRPDNGFDYYLRDGGVGICIVINNNIYVHGGISQQPDIGTYIDINNKINNITNLASLNEVYRIFHHRRISSDNQILWTRFYGDAAPRTRCGGIDRDMNLFMRTQDQQYRLLIGHCRQNDNQLFGHQNLTQQIIHRNPQGYRETDLLPETRFTHRSHIDGTKIVYSNTNGGNNTIQSMRTNNEYQFGIVLDCDIDNRNPDNNNNVNNNVKLIKLDCGMSRGVDQFQNGPHTQFGDINLPPNQRRQYTAEEKLYINIMTKTPQVFKITRTDMNNINHLTDTLEIIKSTFENTRTNMPIPSYLNGTGNDNRSSVYVNLGYDHRALPDASSPAYYKKYLKYKNKYLSLKKK